MKKYAFVIASILYFSANSLIAEQAIAPNILCDKPDAKPVIVTRFNLARIYPTYAIEKGLTDRLVLKLAVSDTGTVTNAEIVESRWPEIFGPSAIREAMKMTFEPARKNCVNIASSYDLEIKFSFSK